MTSFVSLNEIITLELAQTALAKLQYGNRGNRKGGYSIATLKEDPQIGMGQTIRSESTDELEANTPNITSTHISKGNQSAVVQSIVARDGEIILPAEICVIRKGETFKQWTARAKHASIEATRAATGTLKSTAERLGVTTNSLKGHLHRAKTFQPESNVCEENP